MRDKTILTVCAIGAISILEIVALSQGINGTALSLSIAGIAGLGGYEIKGVVEHVKRVKKA